MLIYDALKQDHREVLTLVERLVNSSDASTEVRSELIQKIRDELVPHARAEEAVFYNSLRDIDGTREMVAHGYVEHMEAEAMLRTLQAMDAVNADWHKVAQKFKKDLEHHIKEEETEIIPAAEQVLAVEEAEMMATAFQKMKPEIREAGFMSNTMDAIVNMMPTRFASTFRQFLHRA